MNNKATGDNVSIWVIFLGVPAGCYLLEYLGYDVEGFINRHAATMLWLLVVFFAFGLGRQYGKGPP